MIESKKKCIVIDEIDISLDSSAQVELVNILRGFCKKHGVNIIFTTHSLALMQTLNDNELYYMYNEDNITQISKKSYNFIKSALFGFKGWDKYILTEDKTLQNYLEHIIDKNHNSYFFDYKIIYIGGGSNVVDLMKRNEKEEFLAAPENVICILDGDQACYRHVQHNKNVYCIPFQSIEKDLYHAYKTDETIPRVKIIGKDKQDKQVYNGLIKTWDNGWTESSIFKYLENLKPEECLELKMTLIDFINKPKS